MNFEFNKDYFKLYKMPDITAFSDEPYQGIDENTKGIVINNEIYVFDKFYANKGNRMFKYSNNSWNLVQDNAPYRYSELYFVMNGLFFISLSDGNLYIYNDNIYTPIFNLKENNINSFEQFVILNNDIHLLGVYQNSSNINHYILSVQFINNNVNIEIKKSIDLPIKPYSEFYINAVVLNSNIYLVCGLENKGLIYKLNEELNEWTIINTLFSEKKGAYKVFTFKNHIYIHTFINSDSSLDKNIYKIDSNGNLVEILPQNLYGHHPNNGIILTAGNSIHILGGYSSNSNNNFATVHHKLLEFNIDLNIYINNKNIIYKGYDEDIKFTINNTYLDKSNCKIILDSENGILYDIYDITENLNNFTENLVLNNDNLNNIETGQYDLIFLIDNYKYNVCKFFKNDIINLDTENIGAYIDNRDITFKGENVKCQVFNDISNNDKFNINVNFIENS